MHDDRKFRGRSLASIGLWTVCGTWSASNRTDGFVPESVARRWSNSRRLACELVAAGLWENAEQEGERGWQFCEWAKNQPLKDEYETPTDRLHWKRNKRLERNSFLREQIHARDRDHCRYCAVRVSWKDRRGGSGGTYDHVDPDEEDNRLENIVVACRRCNGRKRDRTPDEAGMVLLPPPAPFNPDIEAGPVQNGASISPEKSRESAPISPVARETGRGQVGAGSVQVGAGSGPTNGNGKSNG